MPLSIPPELKKITPYIRRAEELDKDKNPESRLVSYYCRQYAVHTGIALATSPPGKNCLGELLGALEGEKTAMDSFTRDESKFLCNKFANQVFDKADAEDRAGAATKNTAKTFYAAASFLEILQQFFNDDDDSEEWGEIKKRSVYAKWKATDILKAFKEGREPTPGGYGESNQGEEADTSNEDVAVNHQPPVVETVLSPEVPSAPSAPEPSVRMPSPEPEPVPEDDDSDQGTEVLLGPPPSYPGGEPKDLPPPASAPSPSSVQRPPLSFSPPQSPLPVVPQVQKSPKKSPSIFGFGKKKNKSKANKAEITDALELAKFAVAALEDKNTDLAVERMQKAIQVLGH